MNLAAAFPQPPAREKTIPPASVVQQWLDRAAHFNMFSMPDPYASNSCIHAPRDGRNIIGLRVNEVLHRFSIVTQPATAQAPLRARNSIGEPAGVFSHRWMFAPDDFLAAPGREPPPTALTPSRTQRFVMLDSICTFGDGEDGFRGFGTGQTFPSTVNGRPQLLATAVGAVIEGFGKFRGQEEGTYVYCGSLTPERGFTGNILLRVMDRRQAFRTNDSLHLLDVRTNPEPATTYLLVRGQAVPSDRVTGPGGGETGLTVEQGIRLVDLEFKAGGQTGLQSTDRVGPLIGRITAHVAFNPASPGGSVYDPIPFTSHDEFVYSDERGQSIGGFTATSSEGRVFHTEIAGQPGIRFGGTGQILAGTGPFETINGLMTDNSVVTFTPHVSASVYVLRLHDPSGKFSIG